MVAIGVNTYGGYWCHEMMVVVCFLQWTGASKATACKEGVQYSKECGMGGVEQLEVLLFSNYVARYGVAHVKKTGAKRQWNFFPLVDDVDVAQLMPKQTLQALFQAV